MAFQVKDGIYFERLVDGGVRVFQRAKTAGDPLGLCTELTLVEATASQWATVVAAVSQRGTEYPGNHDKALAFHQED